MAAASPISGSTGYSFVSYPSDYIFAHGSYAVQPQAISSLPSMPSLHQIELSGVPATSATVYPPHYATFAHLGQVAQVAQNPPSPMLTHAHLPPSPIIHGQAPPPSPDRCSADTKVMRHILTAMTKMQSTMKDLAERQEQILDRMSLLEQRVGRIDDSLGTLLEQTELIVEDSKTIRARVDDSEGQDAFAKSLTSLMDDVVEKLIGGLGEEMKDLKKAVKETEKTVKSDSLVWGRAAMGQRYRDAIILGEEEQKEVVVV